MSEIQEVINAFDGGSRWIKDKLFDLDGKVCLLGAFCVTGVSLSDERKTLIANTIKEMFPERLHSAADIAGAIIWFNDHNDTIYADVEAVLQKVEAKESEFA